MYPPAGANEEEEEATSRETPPGTCVDKLEVRPRELSVLREYTVRLPSVPVIGLRHKPSASRDFLA